MFKVYHSNSLAVLKSLLIELIRREPQTDPFKAEQILVQSPGMAQWLKLELAEATGIAASVDFPLPASFLWKSFSAILPDVPERSAFNKEAMSWKLMALLPGMLSQPEFSSLRGYLEHDQGDFRLYQLSKKIADVFDQYLVYRPDWIDDWEQVGSLAAKRHPWQPILWRELVAYTAELEQSHWHRANMFDAFVKRLRKQEQSDLLPERLFVFGISALPDNYLHALKAMGQKVDVHLMVTNPCRYYWGDILDQAQIARISRRWLEKPGYEGNDILEAGNPLLASFGKLGRDYIYQLQDSTSFEIEAFADPERASLLNAVQQDILDLEDRSRFPDDLSNSNTKQCLDENDHSIVLHSCHSPLREVEVLHDQLLSMFAEDDSLTPREIIIMMPDVAAYAPYIESVFGSVSGNRYIPFSISDRNQAQENLLLQSFEKVLQLKKSRFTVSDLLELLEVPAVLRRFNLDQEDFQKLRFWIDDANIRWGLDGEQRDLWQLPLFEQNSWRFGIQRMLAGYALGETESTWQGIAPYTEVEGLAAELLGELANFIDLMADIAEVFEGEKPLHDWLEQINHFLERLYQPDEQDEIALSRIREVMQQLQQQLLDARYTTDLSADVVAHYLIDGINQQRSTQRFLAGAVNFCTLMPMRSIPFKVVCLLGMNDGAYPRTLAPLGFDLMNDYPKRGDRSRRDDDRYLFLEALLSAEQRFYISYVGRSIRDNSEKIPSVLVSELLDYIQQGYCLERDQPLAHTQSGEKLIQQLSIQHPLTPFSQHYFSEQAGDELFSYAAEWLPAVNVEKQRVVVSGAKKLSSVTLSEIDVSDLLAFLRDPCRHFFQSRLKVYFYQQQIEAHDDEPFELDKLQEYLLKQRYLDAAIRDENLDQLDQLVKAEGETPVGHAGVLSLAKIRKDAEELSQKLEPWLSGSLQRKEVRLSLNNISVQGWLEGCYGDRLVRYRAAQIKPRDRLLTWVEHLLHCAIDGVNAEETVYRGLSGLCRYQKVSTDEAQKLISDLLDLYQQGMSEPLAFDIGLAHEYFKKIAKQPEQGSELISRKFIGSQQQRGLLDNPYFSRIFSDPGQFETPFIANAEQIYLPMLNYLQEGDDD